MKARRFCARPVVVEAVEWTGANRADVADFVDARLRLNTVEVLDEQQQWRLAIIVPTPSGYHLAMPGDMVLRGSDGVVRVCKRLLFDRYYDESGIGDT